MPSEAKLKKREELIVFRYFVIIFVAEVELEAVLVRNREPFISCF